MKNQGGSCAGEGNLTQQNGGMTTEYKKKLILTFQFPKLQFTQLIHISQYYKVVANTPTGAQKPIMLSTLDE